MFRAPIKASTKNGSTDSDYTYVLESAVKVLSVETRVTFYWILLLICIFTVIGNICAIYSILRRKCKFLQKTCIVSLAISDIATATIYTVNNLDSFAHEYYVWNLGEFLCNFIPMAQIGGTTASSVALLIIALDRYQNVIYALSKRWNPSPIICLSTTAILWMLCAVISYPLYEFFNLHPIKIVLLDPYNINDTTFEDAFLCVTTQKFYLGLFYGILCILIFCPLFAIFLWFYYNIAALVWRHRKPVQSKYKGFSKHVRELDSGNTKSTELSTKIDSPSPKPEIKKNIQVERKIRTFKIVITLMLTFIACRLPYLLFNLIKLNYNIANNGEHNKPYWDINFALLSLSLFNCALNPFLYTFLNETINLCSTVYEFILKVFCCFYVPSEFEEFRKENPFVIPRSNECKNNLNGKVKEPWKVKLGLGGFSKNTNSESFENCKH